MSKVLVIPCYNEEARLNPNLVDELLDLVPDLRVIFVNDGSKDGTLNLLRELKQKNARIEILDQDKNRGKAEAVRAGLSQAVSFGSIVGYADADFATPPRELARLLALTESENKSVVMGSRVRLLGSQIERQPMRHYLGRIFATFASLALRLPVYDTQCGAKMFHVTDALRQAVQAPFETTWIFDVELLARLLSGPKSISSQQILEVPLKEWRDIKGSKLKWTSMVGAAWDLLRIAIHLRFGREPIVEDAANATSTK